MKPPPNPPENLFTEKIAATYDADTELEGPGNVGPAVACLTDLAAGGLALEFGIGTGRIALPLAERIEVAGIDLSPQMVARLREKPGGAALPVTIGDVATTRVKGTFALIYMVFNTLTNLTSQEAQTACFKNAALHLAPGGAFVVEALVPALHALVPGQPIVPFRFSPDHWGIDEYDVVHQRLTSHHMRVRGERVDRVAMPFRYVWPSELDLMARIAGLVPDARWGGWDRAPFTAESRSHVSVWRLPETGR